MAIKIYKPTTPGRRQMTVTDYSGLSKVAPERSLLAPLKKNSGRNSYGRITVRHRGGGNRRKYRIIDFKTQTRSICLQPLLTLEYDPEPLRSHRAGSVRGRREALHHRSQRPEGRRQRYESGADADIKPGNALPLTNIPVGTFIHNVELYPGKGAQLARAAGIMAQLMAKEGDMRADPTALRRAEKRSGKLHGYHWPGRQHRP